MFAPLSDMIERLAALFDRGASAMEAFGREAARRCRRLVRFCKIFGRLAEPCDTASLAVASGPAAAPCHEYRLLGQVATGEVTDVHLAAADGVRYVVKVTRSVGGNRLMAAEARHLKLLMTQGGDRCYREYLPSLVERFTVPGDEGDLQANVFLHREGFYTLEEIHHQHPDGLDGRHLAWIFKRMLTVIGFARSCGLVHGAVLPPHVMLHSENHGLQLVDWIHAVRIGGVLRLIPTAYRDWYPREVLRREPASPATDIFLAAKCLIYLSGGNPVSARWPETIPLEMRRFVDTCLFAAPRMRPQDAWNLHDEFDELLVRLFGPPRYHRLVMS